MFCKNCGKEIDDNAAVCPNCGVPTPNMAAQQPAAPAPAPVEEKKKTNVFAIVGFVLSLVAGIFSFINDYVYWIAVVAAFVLSILGIVWANKKNANLKGLAIAGLVLSILALFFWVLLIILVIVLGIALM